jgi:flagellar basal body-associated protein FliL
LNLKLTGRTFRAFGIFFGGWGKEMSRLIGWFSRQNRLWLVLAIVIVSGVILGITATSGKSTKPAENACPVVMPPLFKSDQTPVTLSLSDSGGMVKIAVGTQLNVVLTYNSESANKWKQVETSNPEIIQLVQTVDNPDNS